MMTGVDVAALEKSAKSAGAAQGEVFFQLGMEYSTGRNISASLVQAHKWFNLAVMKGNRDAVIYRNELAQEMSFSEVAEALRLARDWLAHASDDEKRASA